MGRGKNRRREIERGREVSDETWRKGKSYVNVYLSKTLDFRKKERIQCQQLLYICE